MQRTVSISPLNITPLTLITLISSYIRLFTLYFVTIFINSDIKLDDIGDSKCILNVEVSIFIQSFKLEKKWIAIKMSWGNYKIVV